MPVEDFWKSVSVWELGMWIAVLLGVAGLAIKGWPYLKKFIDFIDDVAGEPARPGTPARPGLMERMLTFESKQAQIKDKLDTVHHELFPNSGKSLRDQTNRIERLIANDNDRITEVERRVEELQGLPKATTGILKTVNSIERRIKE